MRQDRPGDPYIYLYLWGVVLVVCVCVCRCRGCCFLSVCTICVCDLLILFIFSNSSIPNSSLGARYLCIYIYPCPSLRHLVTQGLLPSVVVLGCGFSLPVCGFVRTFD